MSGVTRSRPKLVSPPTPEAIAIEMHSKSMDRVADALTTVAEEMKLHREQSKPVHDFYDLAGDALTCFRRNLSKYGPWLLASMPVAISLINGVSPQAAKLIQFIVTLMQSAPNG